MDNTERLLNPFVLFGFVLFGSVGRFSFLVLNYSRTLWLLRALSILRLSLNHSI